MLRYGRLGKGALADDLARNVGSTSVELFKNSHAFWMCERFGNTSDVLV